DVADLGVQALMVERRRAEESDLLFRSEEELDAAVRAALGERTPGPFEHRRDGGLVVRAEDGAARVAHDTVLDHRLERPLRGHGVEVRAEEDRSAAVAARLDPAVQ